MLALEDGRAHPRLSVTARSLKEAIDALKQKCTDLDFTHYMRLSSPDVDLLQRQRSAVQAALAKVPGGTSHLKEFEDLSQAENTLSEQLRGAQKPAIELFENLDSECMVEKLHLDAKSIGDDAVEVLAKALAENKTLLHLDLSSNLITPIGAQILGLSLRRHCLRELHLDNTLIGNVGVHKLALGMQGNEFLNLLSLRNNKIGPELPTGLVWYLTGNYSTSSNKDNDENLPTAQLQVLHLDKNAIASIPLRLGAAVHLTEVTLSENPIKNITPSIVAGGWSKIFELLSSELREEERRRKAQLLLRQEQLRSNPTGLPWQVKDSLPGTTADDL